MMLFCKTGQGTQGIVYPCQLEAGMSNKAGRCMHATPSDRPRPSVSPPVNGYLVLTFLLTPGSYMFTIIMRHPRWREMLCGNVMSVQFPRMHALTNLEPHRRQAAVQDRQCIQEQGTGPARNVNQKAIRLTHHQHRSG